VQFVPWLLGSIAPQPNDDVRAAFVGLSLQHDRRHTVRAVLEGVAMNLAWLLPAVESFVGHEFDFVRFGGGAAQSDPWAQVLADALQRPVHQLEEPRATNARGAAFLAFSTLGTLSIDDVPSLLRTRAIRQPDPANRDAMDRALRRLTDLHRALVNLTNL
jgi:xylulokinase